MSDLVERLRDKDPASVSYFLSLCDEAADEITRLRERVALLDANFSELDEAYCKAEDELTRLRERIAHLERVVAADAMRRSNGRIARLDAEEVYDAVRKGEG